MENRINPYIWCLTGAALGWLGGLFMKSEGFSVVVENVLVGMFGAFIGGEFVLAQVLPEIAKIGRFSMQGFSFALVGGLIMLTLLRLMRRTVGPMKPSKPKPRRNY